MFACGVRSARERSLEEDHAATKMAEMEESGLILIAEIIQQNGTLSCQTDIVLFFFV